MTFGVSRDIRWKARLLSGAMQMICGPGARARARAAVHNAARDAGGGVTRGATGGAKVGFPKTCENDDSVRDATTKFRFCPHFAGGGSVRLFDPAFPPAGTRYRRKRWPGTAVGSWTNLRSHPPRPGREARICAPGCAPENPELSDPPHHHRAAHPPIHRPVPCGLQIHKHRMGINAHCVPVPVCAPGAVLTAPGGLCESATRGGQVGGWADGRRGGGGGGGGW
eukprot:gene15012-biopygen11188